MVPRVLQGYYGGLTPKPTKLLFTRAPKNVEEILVGARCTSVPSAAAVGKQADGPWATTKLKEYPKKGFGFALGRVFAAALPRTGLEEHPKEFHDFVQDLLAGFNVEAGQGADFNPATFCMFQLRN